MTINPEQLALAGMPPASPRPPRARPQTQQAVAEPHGDEMQDAGPWVPHHRYGSGIKTMPEPNHGGYSPEYHLLTEGEGDDQVYTSAGGKGIREVPIQNAGGPQVWANQDGVSLSRMAQLERNPATGNANPPGIHPEVPTGYVNTAGEVLISDGNHRTAAALRRNEMFMQMDTW